MKQEEREKTASLFPQLRFPDFRSSGAWKAEALSEFAIPITERVGERSCTLMSITSGFGLVSQVEKFGRDIAGKQYRSYFLLQRGDFAYNKSATKDYPQGFIARYYGTEPAGVPNSIFTCFRLSKGQLNPDYLNHLFFNNLHGQWLRQLLTVGARAHGSLNVDDGDILSIPIPVPAHKDTRLEQQKIADCLSSVDELLTLETRKLNALKAHNREMMRQLFPAEAETLPRIRFREFQDARAWRSAPIGDFFETSSGGTPDRSNKEYWGGGIPWITTALVNFNHIEQAQEFLTNEGLKNSSAKIFPAGTILLAMYGQGKTRGKVAILDIPAATNQACAAILPKQGIDPEFVLLTLSNRYEELRALSNSGGQENLSQTLIRSFCVSIPWDIEEQNKVKSFLSPLNELISEQGHRIEALTQHKTGLMQQLFPVMDEVQS